MWHYLLLGLIWLGVIFGGNMLAIMIIIELAEADEQQPKPPKRGKRLPVAAPLAA